MIFMTPPTDCRNWKNVLQLIFLILIDYTNYRSLMYFWSTCLSQCLGKKQTIMRLSFQPAGAPLLLHQLQVTLCIPFVLFSPTLAKTIAVWVAGLQLCQIKALLNLEDQYGRKLAFTNFVLSFYLLSISDGELFVPIGELLRGSDLPFLGLRILDLLLWLLAVGQLSNHNAVLLTLQKFPSAYSGGSVNLVIDSQAAEF